MPNIRYERVQIDTLKPYPGNARQGNVAVLQESLKEHGQYRPLVVQESTGYILAGNHTWLAAKANDDAEVEVGVIDVDDEQARKIVLMDNRSNDLATYDDKALAELLGELSDLSGTGFVEQDLSSLLASLGTGGFSKKDLEMVIKVPANSVTKPGDVITMGPHVLYCADSLEFPIVESTVDMVWTDPPYLIGYQESSSYMREDGKKIENENLSETDAMQFRWKIAQLLLKALKPGAVFYLHMPPGIDQALWTNEMDSSGLKCSQILQWIKDHFTFTRQDYHYRSEPILYGWKPGAAHRFMGDRTQDSVWELPRPKRSKDHPTMKPVDLAIRCIENSSEPDDIVFDPFAGSGTVMVACMQTRRHALMIELDPAYCDVIVERWERLTSEKAKRSQHVSSS